MFAQNRRLLIVVAHPVKSSFVTAAAERIRSRLLANEHEVRFTDLYGEGFDPALGAVEWETRHHGVPATLANYVDDLQWCTELVLVYPTWYGSMPAMMKGWFDRVRGKGVAWDLPPKAAMPRALLKNITRIWVVSTHGSPKWVNVVQGEGGRRYVRRATRLTCATGCRVKWLGFYGSNGASHADRQAFLERIVTALE